MTRSFVLFGDGFLQEGKTTYCYSIGKDKLTFLEHSELEVLDKNIASYEHELSDIDVTDGGLKLTYEKKKAVLTPLKTVKNKKKSELKAFQAKKDFSLSVIKMIEKEYSRGFFVLPVPENILVDSEIQPHFIYKGSSSMPLTGFAFTDCLIHAKRLIQYIFVSKEFSELLQPEQLETSDKYVIAISEAESFETLKVLLGSPEKESKVTLEKLTEVGLEQVEELANKEDEGPQDDSVLRMLEQSKHDRQVEKINSKKPEVKGEARQKKPSKQAENVSVKRQKNRSNDFRIEKTVSLYTILLGLGLFISLGITTFLVLDKLSTPSRLNELKTEIADTSERLNTKGEAMEVVSDELELLEQELKEIKDENKVLTEEIASNVAHLKKALTQNEKLKTELGKK